MPFIGRGHAVLADAVMDVAAGVVARRDAAHALDQGQVGAGQVGRAADQFRHRRDQRFQHLLAGLAAWRASACCSAISALQRGHRLVQGVRQAGRRSPARTPRACGWRARRLSQARRGAAPRAPAACQLLGQIVGHARTAAAFQPSACLRRLPPRPGPARSRARRRCRPWCGAPKPMMVRQAISVGFLARIAKDSAAAICAGSCPSTRLTAQP